MKKDQGSKNRDTDNDSEGDTCKKRHTERILIFHPTFTLWKPPLSLSTQPPTSFPSVFLIVCLCLLLSLTLPSNL